MKLDIPEQTAEQKAAETTRMVERLQNQARIRESETMAPLPMRATVQVDPREMQLLAHFRALTTDYARKVAVDQLASLARLCANCTKG